MANINLTTQHKKENLSVVASSGALLCMVVIIVGIKLWWFKHRLSFEHSSTQNGTAGGATKAVIVPRRSKQQKYKKDKRYSQQIYESVEVHGVFRQKLEDDLEIQRPQQLPPVRVRHLSDSNSFVIPPPRAKKREQVHSTAFEDLEIVSSSLNTASSSDLTIMPEINTKITLTFEEFERQFKLKEKEPEISEQPTFNNESLEVPVPPLRLNRSSSAITQPEKPQRFLKSAQSITIPEFNKIVEKRPSGFASPKEDLRKVGNYDETPAAFETFGQRRPTGYIKYEEVDNDLQEQYERELNAELDISDTCEGPQLVSALTALRNERITYHNDLNESPNVLLTEEYNFNIKSHAWKSADYKEDEFVNHRVEIKQLHLKKFSELDTSAGNYEDPRDVDSTEHQSLKDLGFIESIKSSTGNKITDAVERSKNVERMCVTEFQKAGDLEENSPAGVDCTELPQITKEYKAEDRTVEKQKSQELFEEKINDEAINENSEMFDSLSFEENQFNNWPQFEEKIETPKVNIRKLNNQELHKESSVEDGHDDVIEVTNVKEGNETRSQRGSTDLLGHRPESSQLKDMDEWQESFTNNIYEKVRSFMTADSFTTLEDRAVTFDASVTQNSDSEEYENSAIKQRRPTGFIRESEYFVTLDDEAEGDNKQSLSAQQKDSSLQSRPNVEIFEIQAQKVNFKDMGSENETEKFTLNQRRPTGFVRLPNDFTEQEDFEDFSKVKFSETTNFRNEDEIWNSPIKQRRPTSYIKKLEMLDLPDDETILNKERETTNTGFSNQYDEIITKTDYDNETEALRNQMTPTEIMRNEKVDQLKNESCQTNSKQVNFQMDQMTFGDEKPQFGNEKLKQRRPTGFVRKKELKCLDQPAPIFQPSNHKQDDDFNNYLWQEMEKDVEQDMFNNYEEEFAKIRHSYEINEADFLELKDELQKSPTSRRQQPAGFGKTIEDDWDNFEKLKMEMPTKPQSPPNIKITFYDAEWAATTSILKDYKIEEEIQAKPRKSKVTFDFKTDERLIPTRKKFNNSEEDPDYNDDVYEKIPPQPMQRVTNICYNTKTVLAPVVSVPTDITLFGNQISREDSECEDNWSAIRKHRNLTEEFKNVSIDSKPSPSQLTFNTTSKPSYRNPMAQLAIQRAKEVRSDMDGFKSRSINDRKPEIPKRQKQNIFNLNSSVHESTEA